MIHESGLAGAAPRHEGDNVNLRTSQTIVEKTQFLLSPEEFDFEKNVKVVVNGRVTFDGRVEKSVATLLKWAAKDNDRTMLFGAEIKIEVK